MQEAVDVAVQLKYDRIREESNTANQQFLDSIDEGMKKIIKEQVKKEVSKITPKIEKSGQFKQLNKALVDAYDSRKNYVRYIWRSGHNKKTSRGADDDPRTSAGTDRGQKKKLRKKNPFYQCSSETTTDDLGKTYYLQVSKTHKQSASHLPRPKRSTFPDWFQQPTRLPSPDHAWNKSVPAVHESVQPWLSNLAQRQAPRESFDELTDNTFDFSAFVMNRLNVQTLTPELLAGPTFELMKGTCKSLTELEYFCKEVYKATTEKLDWINPEGRQYPHDLRQPLPLRAYQMDRRLSAQLNVESNDSQIRQIRPLGNLTLGQKAKTVLCICASKKGANHGRELLKRWIIAVTKVEIVEWQNYKHLDWITVRRDDDVLYKFKEGDFHRLRIQDIEDMLLLLVQGKVTNLNVEERIAFNVSLRMFTRSVVIQRRVEDLQLGVESYQKKLNLTKPDTYRSNLRRQDAYTPYSDPRGFIYENKDKKNRLMRIDELHKFSERVSNNYKAVRLRFSDPMIQPEPEGSTQGYPLVSVEVLRLLVFFTVSDPEAHEALAGPDPEPMKEDQTGSDSGKLHVSLAGPNPEHMDDEFLATAYPKVHENLKLITHERVIDDKPERTKLDDALLKVLERHTADLIEKYSVLPGPESVKNQESKKSPKEIIRAKKEQGEEKQDSTYSIRSTDKVDLEEFDLKSALFKHMNTINDDDEDMKMMKASAGSNQGRSTKRRRSDSAASGSAQPPPKDDDQKHSDKLNDQYNCKDEGNDSDMEDTDNAHIPKVSTTTWFKPIPESERPATPEPEWTIPPNDFPEPENNWANTYATTYKAPEENKLQRKTYDIGSFIKWFCRRTGKKKLCKADLEGPAFNLVKAFHKNIVFLQYQMDECHKLLTNKVDLYNPEGHQIQRNVYEPLPLGGPPGDKERRIALSISKLKAARYLDFGLEELVPSLWVESEREYDISAVYGITHWWFRRKEFYINKHSEPSDREAVRSQMRILSVISVKVFEKYGYNYLREIILRRADYQEYKISEKDFKKNDLFGISS
ncbi:hypothetical protein Tco_0878265 [Tanacetum coccineum]|uniref:Uncharacterized protein n=1 Tax=Tanacetum coccineum TaxID=301880 RepID=A0ABQ5C2R3_9ASTR